MHRPSDLNNTSSSTFRRLFAALAFAVAGGILPAAVFAGAERYVVYVSNERAGDVSVIDGETRKVVRTIEAGKRPRGIHVSDDGRTLYVATSGSPRMGPGADRERAKSLVADKSADGIAVIDLAAGKRVRQLRVGSDPEEFALGRDGRSVIVANEDIAEASVWDIETGRLIAKAEVSEEPEGVALHPSRAEVYVACEDLGDIYVLHPETGAHLAKLTLGGRPRTIVFSPDGTRAYIPLETKGSIAIIDAETHTLLETVPVPGRSLPMGSAISPDGREVYVSTGRAGNSVVVLDTETRKIVATIPVGGRPWGVALSPNGQHLFTANGASNDVSVIDVRARRELTRIPVGEGPWGVAIGPVVGE